MQYNTALMFFTCGAGLITLQLGRTRWATACGVVATTVGLLTLTEYLAGVDLGIDQLLMRHYITVETSHPGRMAPNTALCFALCGTALVLIARLGWSRRAQLLSGFLGSAVLLLGCAAFLGYMVEAETAYGWGHLTRMAVHTAAGFELLGAGLMLLAWREGIARVSITALVGREEQIPGFQLANVKQRPTVMRRKVIAISILTMAFISTGVATLVIRELHRVAIAREQKNLQTLAASWGQLIDAAIRFDRKHTQKDQFQNSWRETLSQISDAHEHLLDEMEGTKEFMLAKQEDTQIVFLLRQRHVETKLPQPVPFASERAEPMRRALRGLSGTMKGLDYRGVEVLAAYQPLQETDCGLVAKVDLAEIQAPFNRAILLAAGVIFVIIMIGSVFVILMVNPLIQGLEIRTVKLASAYTELQKEIEERRRTEEALRESAQELSVRGRVSSVFLTLGNFITADDDEIYGKTLPIILQALESKYGVFGYIDEKGDLVVPSMTRHIWEKCNVPDKCIVFPRHKWGDSTWPRAIREMRTIYSNEPSTSIPQGHVPIDRHISLPIVHKGEAIGLIQVANKETDYDEKDVGLLESIGETIAPVLAARLLARQEENARIEAERCLILAKEETETAYHSLRESEERYRTLVENAPEAIIVFDIDKRVLVDANQNAVNLFRYDRESLLALEPEDLEPLFHADGQSPNELMSGVTRGAFAGETPEFEWTLLSADGDKIPCEVRLVRLPSRTSRLFRASIIDISRRKKLECQLRHAQKLEAIGQLAAGVAHEINTPTQYVSDNTNFLKEVFGEIQPVLKKLGELANADQSRPIPTELIAELRVETERADLDYLTEEIPRAIHQTLEGIERISKIVRAMGEFSHPSMDKTATDINRGIESTITVAINEWKYVAEIVTELDPQLPLVPCIPGDLNQVVLNMVVNAAHAIADVVGDGSGGKGTITISTRQVDEWAEIRISDTGTGIPEDIRDRIFHPFYTTKEIGKGTGQGLSIAHAVVVHKHQGTLTVESEVGKGTTFLIRLPMTDPVVVTEEVMA
ncbi:GAF domain-containing protein [bacterium]|nr:GAF domain-containing protein [bacterium]